MTDATKILKRYPGNPIITHDMIPGIAAVYNPSPVMYQGKTILVLSTLPYNFDLHHQTPVGSYIAVSEDGINFDIRTEAPFMDFTKYGEPFDRVIGTAPIDSRITKIDDEYYILTPIFGGGEGPFTVMGKTKDFETYTPVEIVTLPANRGSSLFPEKIDGRYYRLDRPSSGDAASGSIWLSSSPDLIHWGCHRPLVKAGYAIWNIMKIGATPPIKTSEGWLVIVHGVFSWGTASGQYSIGAMLLDLKEPSKIIGMTKSWLLAPEADYEVRGMVNNVCFPCGAIADIEKDELRLYYGAADTSVCLASGSLSDVLEACKRCI